MKRPIATAIAAIALVGGAGYWWNLQDEQGERSVLEGRALAQSSPGFGAADYGTALSYADIEVDKRRALLAAAPDQWVKQEGLAAALMGRFRLTGDYTDIDEARTLLDAALKSAPKPAGPNISRAVLAMAEHDLASTGTALDRYDRTVVKNPGDQSDAFAMRGDIAFQHGKLEEARELYRRADAIAPAIASKVRLAEIELRTGHPRAAIAITESALVEQQKLTPGDYADMALLIANQHYAAGDIARARAWIDRANESFPGYWLAQAYDAQQRAVEGDVSGSIAALSALAETSAQPEVMDALAGILREAGQTDAAATWAERSAALWEERLKTAPAAYRLHAAEHFLDFGDPKRALALARAEIAQRPSAMAIEVMASALTANGRPQEALRWLDRAQQAGWSMTSLTLARANALEALGRENEAAQLRAQAAEGASLAGDPRRPLIRFGHY